MFVLMKRVATCAVAATLLATAGPAVAQSPEDVDSMSDPGIVKPWDPAGPEKAVAIPDAIYVCGITGEWGTVDPQTGAFMLIGYTPTFFDCAISPSGDGFG